jgi:hypothetical protein
MLSGTDIDNLINPLAQLPENSDDWSPPRPSQEAIRTARQVLLRLAGTTPPNLVTTALNGTIYMRWYIAHHRRALGIFIYDDGSLEYSWEESNPLSLDKVSELLNRLRYEDRKSF